MAVCSICWRQGHNKRGCPQRLVGTPPGPPGFVAVAERAGVLAPEPGRTKWDAPASYYAAVQDRAWVAGVLAQLEAAVAAGVVTDKKGVVDRWRARLAALDDAREGR